MRFADYRGGALRGLRAAVRRAHAADRGVRRRTGLDRAITPRRHDEPPRRARPVAQALQGARRPSSAWPTAQERLLALRLVLGGLDRRPRARPAGVRAVRGLGRVGQGRRDQAPRRAARPAPRARRAVRRADARREAPPLPAALLAGAAGLGRDGRARPLLVRPRARRARRGLRDRGRVAARLRRDRRLRARRCADEGTVLVKFWLHISDEEQLKRFEARETRPAEALEAHRRGLAQPREARASTRRRSRRWSSAPSTDDAPWHLVEADSKRYARVKVVETVSDGDRGRHAPARDRPPPRPS